MLCLTRCGWAFLTLVLSCVMPCFGKGEGENTLKTFMLNPPKTTKNELKMIVSHQSPSGQTLRWRALLHTPVQREPAATCDLWQSMWTLSPEPAAAALGGFVVVPAV